MWTGPPSSHAIRYAAFDSTVGKLVVFQTHSDGTVMWHWDGQCWIGRAVAGGPLSLDGAGCAFDAHRGILVLQGGMRSDQVQTDTWEWDGSHWRRIQHWAPGSRANPAMTFDSSRRVVLLYGDGDRQTDLWSWDGQNWRLLAGVGPSRGNVGLAFDPYREVTMLFSPWYGTWEWDGVRWTQREAQHYPLYDPKIAYDANRRRLVLVARTAYEKSTTWEWDGTRWERIEAATPNSYFPGLTFDAVRRCCVLIDGAQTASAQSRQPWEWDGSHWTLAAPHPPGARIGTAYAYDTQFGVTLSFGGWPPDHPMWSFDGRQWSQLQFTGPLNRRYHTMCYDAGRAATLMHGGEDARVETWLWDAAKWHRVAKDSLMPTHRMGSAYDESRGQVVMYGGCVGHNCVSRSADTWLWDGVTWTRRSVPGPGLRAGHAMAYDPARQVVVLFGGSHLPSDTWEWDGQTWTEASVVGPPPREAAAMVYDPRRSAVLLTGGYSGSTVWSDLWEWDGVEWREIGVTPRRVAEHAMIFDSQCNVVRLFTAEPLIWELREIR